MAILPWGATEPHNYFICLILPTVSCLIVLLWMQPKRHLVNRVVYGASPVTYGSLEPWSEGLSVLSYARYETQRAILGDVVAALHLQGIRKLIIVNGHGGNSFKT